MYSLIDQLRDYVLDRKTITEDQGRTLAVAGMANPFRLIAAASEIRESFKGKSIVLCGIINAKSGRCPEDCAFCSQSAHHCTDAPSYPLIKKDAIIGSAISARDEGAHMFGIVTSGTAITTEEEWAEILGAITGIKASGIKACASLGMLDVNGAKRMKDAGLFRYHHNLETARSFFRNICTTHDYDEDIATIGAAREAGLSVCCGGIIGMGESQEQRLELAFTLRDLGVDCVPVNILDPRPGTRLEGTEPLTPLEILVTIALFRFILPDKDIKLCGGKEKNLRQLLPLGILAGCNSLMTGNYLTTTGRSAALDIEMILDLGLAPEPG